MCDLLAARTYEDPTDLQSVEPLCTFLLRQSPWQLGDVGNVLYQYTISDACNVGPTKNWSFSDDPEPVSAEGSSTCTTLSLVVVLESSALHAWECNNLNCLFP